MVEKDSIEIFNKQISINELKNYVRSINTLNRDQIIDLKYLDKINQMIMDFTGGFNLKNQYEMAANIIRNFLDENQLGIFINEKTEELFSEFQSMFSPDYLKSLEGPDVLYKIFPQKGNFSTLCYYLEYSNEFKHLNGGIGGRSSFKFSLFKYGKTNKWTVGSAEPNLRSLSEVEAIEVATIIRDAIVEGAEYIQNHNLDSIEDYNLFEEELKRIFKESQKHCPIEPNHPWIHKYYSLIFPDKFPGIHNDEKKNDTLRKFRIHPENGFYEMDWQFYHLSKKANIKLYSLFDETIVRLFFESGDIWDSIENGILVDLDSLPTSGGIKTLKPFESDKYDRLNLIYFGAPGTGKSHNLEKDSEGLLECYEKNFERVTFHPDYSYANFVGTYKPFPVKIEDDEGKIEEKITYKYVPGPFMRSLVEALKKPEEPFLLIIEEINRANAAAVFGDIFQLLDRENNISKFPIQSSKEMRKYLEDELSDEVHKSYIFDLLGKEYEKIRIPKNMYIWATMNNADQGVFPIDTAFKRRWDFEYFPINPEDDDRIENIKIGVPPKWKLKNNILKWNDLRQKINDELLEYGINEDKLIGPYFAFDKYLDGDELRCDKFVDIFQNKILMYLYEDAARSKRDRIFDKNVVKILYSDIREKFKEKGIRIFCENIKKDFLDDNDE